MHTRPNHSAGFTFPELLIALGIFTLGFVTVGAIFPTAIMLQKRTIQAVESEALGQNAKAMLQAVPRDLDTAYGTAPTDVFAFDAAGWEQWPLETRTLLADLNGGQVETFWVPLLQNKADGMGGTNWIAYIFVLRNNVTVKNYEAFPGTWTIANPFAAAPQDPVAIPKVTRVDGLTGTGTGFTLNNAERWLDIGDPVLISTGETGNVSNIDGNNVEVNIVGLTGTISIWFAPKPSENQSSPGRKIIRVTNIAK